MSHELALLGTRPRRPDPFSIALIFVATLFDVLSFFRDRSPTRHDFNASGYWLLILAAIGAAGAVFSGLALSKWQVGGTGLVRLHHLLSGPRSH